MPEWLILPFPFIRACSKLQLLIKIHTNDWQLDDVMSLAAQDGPTMIKMPIDQWCQELRANCDLVQDGDKSVSPAEAEKRFNRYVQLVEMVTGKESDEVFRALIDSIRAPRDYGAYEAVHNALWKFRPETFGPCFVEALPKLITCMAKYDQVGRFLCQLPDRKKYLSAFVGALSKASASDRKKILKFIRDNEINEDDEGWFEDASVFEPGG